ncbi:acetoacetate decarboxylase family protein [Leucobacter sp. GX24907]
MRTYDPKTFFRFLGFDPGDQQYECPDLATLNVYCRGDRDQLTRLAGVTPFELTSDVFMLTVADFSNCTMTQGGYFDGGMILPISYGEHRGGNYFFEFEDQHWSTAAGRELWGYPKRYAKFSLETTDSGVRAKIWDYDMPILDLALDFDDSVTGEAWNDVDLTPTIQARAVPEVNGPSFSQFDIAMRNTAANFALRERRLGRAQATIGKIDVGSDLLDGQPLHVLEVLGGEYTVGDFAATAANGTPVVLDSLVNQPAD